MFIQLLLLLLVFANDDDNADESNEWLNFTSTTNYTLDPEQYSQIFLNTFKQFKGDQTYTSQMLISMNFTYSGKLDLLVVNSPMNELYVCYIHQFESFHDCRTLTESLCTNCSNYSAQDLSYQIENVFNYSLNNELTLNNTQQIQQSNKDNTLCVLGCSNKIFQSITLQQFQSNTLQSSLAILVLDNTFFPSFDHCQFTVETCLDNSTINPNISNFCNNVKKLYCDEDYMHLSDIELSIEYLSWVQPYNQLILNQLMVIGLLCIIIILLTIILCILWFRYKRIQKQQIQLSAKIKQL